MAFYLRFLKCHRTKCEHAKGGRIGDSPSNTPFRLAPVIPFTEV